MKKIPVSIYFLLLLILPGLNFALRFFNLPNYFFFIGFRFYGIIFLAGLFLFFYQGLEAIKQTLLSISFKKLLRIFFYVLIPPVVIISTLFVLKKIELGDPDYFYELGLSSFVDFPLYFVWNFPQFFILFTLLKTIEFSFKLKILPNFLLLLLFFLPEIFIFPKISVSVVAAVCSAILFLAISLFVNKKSNPLSFTLYFFITVWMALLLFGSQSETLLQLFLAKTYTTWDGFFEVNKKFVLFIFPAYFFLSLLPIIFMRKES
ncbi:MAG: hypothetical protein Q8S01_08350 [Ignavibacteria bacterium]|nr:hypothetical protein [Ignavibacteria bacterium]